jgi:4-hydroxythreonine-4-phosphate dehydrogenase
MKPLCITMGDPGGLGPELVRRFFAACEPEAPVLLLGPEKSLLRLGRTFYDRLERPEDLPAAPGLYLFEPPGLAGLDVPPGQATVEGGLAAGQSLEWAVRCLQSGLVHGLCTCPLNKAMLQAAGFDFPGHTEFLAERLGTGPHGHCMHLCGPRLRVSLVTTHPPLTQVPGLVTREAVLRCLLLTHAFVQRLGLAAPLAVCGLNPHAGESGRIGREEIEIIAPAIEDARAQGVDVAGPLPADTVFHFAAQGRYAAVLAMYHDQGLGPLKLLHFGQAVNTTLGLRFPRTSPDHGTGYDLVGQGKARLDSFAAAYGLLTQLI